MSPIGYFRTVRVWQGDTDDETAITSAMTLIRRGSTTRTAGRLSTTSQESLGGSRLEGNANAHLKLVGHYTPTQRIAQEVLL